MAVYHPFKGRPVDPHYDARIHFHPVCGNKKQALSRLLVGDHTDRVPDIHQKRYRVDAVRLQVCAGFLYVPPPPDSEGYRRGAEMVSQGVDCTKRAREPLGRAVPEYIRVVQSLLTSYPALCILQFKISSGSLKWKDPRSCITT